MEASFLRLFGLTTFWFLFMTISLFLKYYWTLVLQVEMFDP